MCRVGTDQPDHECSHLNGSDAADLRLEEAVQVEDRTGKTRSTKCLYAKGLEPLASESQ